MISVCIASYGTDHWRSLALERALPSVQDQDCEVVVHHEPGGTVSTSRNGAAVQAHEDWLCFLDADDQLGSGFVYAMQRAIRRQVKHHPDTLARIEDVLLTPAVSYVIRGRPGRPRFWPETPYWSGNWMVIGTLVPRKLFLDVGGFIDYGDPPGSNAYEDWSLWARCQMAGARVEKVPRALYIAHHEETSRHRNVPHSTKIGWHHEIQNALWPEGVPK